MMHALSHMKEKLAPVLVRHRFAIITALIVAFLYGMPQVIAMRALGPAYRGFPYLINDSEGEYMGRIHEIFDGHYSISSPVFHEYKDSVIFVGRFIFPALVFVFLYAL